MQGTTTRATTAPRTTTRTTRNGKATRPVDHEAAAAAALDRMSRATALLAAIEDNRDLYESAGCCEYELAAELESVILAAAREHQKHTGYIGN